MGTTPGRGFAASVLAFLLLQGRSTLIPNQLEMAAPASRAAAVQKPEASLTVPWSLPRTNLRKPHPY
jgi:hypothetical protein